jgi:hypothetical protein
MDTAEDEITPDEITPDEITPAAVAAAAVAASAVYIAPTATEAAASAATPELLAMPSLKQKPVLFIVGPVLNNDVQVDSYKNIYTDCESNVKSLRCCVVYPLGSECAGACVSAVLTVPKIAEYYYQCTEKVQYKCITDETIERLRVAASVLGKILSTASEEYTFHLMKLWNFINNAFVYLKKDASMEDWNRFIESISKYDAIYINITDMYIALRKSRECMVEEIFGIDEEIFRKFQCFNEVMGMVSMSHIVEVVVEIAAVLRYTRGMYVVSNLAGVILREAGYHDTDMRRREVIASITTKYFINNKILTAVIESIKLAATPYFDTSLAYSVLKYAQAVIKANERK